MRTFRTTIAGFFALTMLDENPDLLDVLYEPYHADWRGDEPVGERHWYTNPMYSYHDGRVSSRITTRFVFDSAARFGADATLTERQSEALDAAHAIAERPEMRLAMGFSGRRHAVHQQSHHSARARGI